jgi:Rrf2 family protein
MIKLNRVTEYALISLRHMNRKRAHDARAVTSAREISDQYGLPFEITAKTLQRLRDTGLIDSAQGARGGYLLQSDLERVSLAQFLDLIEGGQSLVACTPNEKLAEAPSDEKEDCHCEYHSACEIRGMMSGLNRRVREFLKGIRLAELTSDAPSPLVQITSFSSSVGAASAGSSQLKSKLEKSS